MPALNTGVERHEGSSPSSGINRRTVMKMIQYTTKHGTQAAVSASVVEIIENGGEAGTTIYLNNYDKDGNQYSIETRTSFLNILHQLNAVD